LRKTSLQNPDATLTKSRGVLFLSRYKEHFHILELFRMNGIHILYRKKSNKTTKVQIETKRRGCL